MWLLTCEGDLFEGKSRWLRPGSAHLIGRTTGRSEGGERIQYIAHKAVSRKHLTIRVGAVKPGDSSRLLAQSEIQVTDGSKIGTTLDGDQIKGETRTLKGKTHTFKLGSYEHLFHLTWQPVVLSFSGTTKKAKEALAAQREQLEQTDIKLISEYVINETTHVISRKRNTVPALQALIQARWLVTEAFVEDLVIATTPDKPVGDDLISLLEVDFKANWPPEKTFLVPSGTEPQPRPDLYLEPNRDRKEVFQDYTFVFLAQAQYDSLLPAITAGGGKALLKNVDPTKSTVEDVVDYIRQIAGHKDASPFRLSEQTGEAGIVVVRFNDKDDTSREFLRELELSLDQRAVEQNEFLDAILMANASDMRRQLEPRGDDADVNGSAKAQNSRSQSEQRPQQERAIIVADSPPPANPPRTQQPREGQPGSEQVQMEQPTEEPSAAARKRTRRVITQSRFKGFDDFDPSQFTRPASASPEPPVNASQASNPHSMDIDDTSQVPRTRQSARKRPAPVTEAEREEDMYASILTSHAAMKRQKTQAAQNGETDSATIFAAESASGGTAGKSSKGKKKATEMDVMAEVQVLRERQEEQRRLDEESLRNIDGVDLSDVKAQVEEMEIPVRERTARNAAETGVSDRWDPAWNGRKNFKKFRRQGERQGAPRLQRVIVTLEEVPKKGHGIGDEYWLSSNSTKRSKSKSQSQSQNTRRSQRTGDDEEEEDDTTRFRRRLQKSREDAEDEEASWEVSPEEIAGQPRDEELQAVVDAAPSQTLATETQRSGAGKRPAAQQGGGPAKKPRQTRLAAPSRDIMNLDDDDDDELKFRRRRR